MKIFDGIFMGGLASDHMVFYLSELSFSFDGRTTFDGFNLTGSFNFHLESYFFVLSYILAIILIYL